MSPIAKAITAKVYQKILWRFTYKLYNINAIKKKNGVIVKARPDVCIGCGLCVEACPSKALHLERRKPDMVPPKTNDDLYDAIMEKKKGTLGKLGVAVKMMLRV